MPIRHGPGGKDQSPRMPGDPTVPVIPAKGRPAPRESDRNMPNAIILLRRLADDDLDGWRCMTLREFILRMDLHAWQPGRELIVGMLLPPRSPATRCTELSRDAARSGVSACLPAQVRFRIPDGVRPPPGRPLARAAAARAA